MKKDFFEFYRPSKDRIEALVRDGTVVFDTNVLLEPYEVAKEGRELLLAVFRDLGARIWIPHQVGLEFQRNRLRSIASERNRTSNAISSVKSSINGIVDQISKLKLAERGIEVDPAPIIYALKEASEAAQKALTLAHQAQPKIGLDDDIRDEIDKIFEGRVGPPTQDQKTLDEIYNQGAVRYSAKIPPGYEDESKSDVFSHGGLIYQRKYGDLLLWRQMIEHAKLNSIKKIIFVTLEKKEDWWQTRDKEIIGPQPHLINEMSREAGVEDFWVFRLPEFLGLANTFRAEKLSPEGIEQIEASDQSRRSETSALQPPRIIERKIRAGSSFEMTARHNIGAWLESLPKVVAWEDHYDIDLLAEDGNGHRTAIEIHILGSWASSRLSMLDLISRVHALKSRANQYAHDACLIVANFNFENDINSRIPDPKIVEELTAITSRAGVGLVVGSVSDFGFVPFFRSNFWLAD